MRKDDFYVVIKFVRTVIGNNCKVVMCLDDIMILLPFLLPFVLQNSLRGICRGKNIPIPVYSFYNAHILGEDKIAYLQVGAVLGETGKKESQSIHQFSRKEGKNKTLKTSKCLKKTN